MVSRVVPIRHIGASPARANANPARGGSMEKVVPAEVVTCCATSLGPRLKVSAPRIVRMLTWEGARPPSVKPRKPGSMVAFAPCHMASRRVIPRPSGPLTITVIAPSTGLSKERNGSTSQPSGVKRSRMLPSSALTVIDQLAGSVDVGSRSRGVSPKTGRPSLLSTLSTREPPSSRARSSWRTRRGSMPWSATDWPGPRSSWSASHPSQPKDT